MGAVSLWTRLPALYLCTLPQKVTPSAHHRHELINLATSQQMCKCDVKTTRHLSLHNDGNVNDSVHAERRAATVGSQLSPRRLHPNLLDQHNRDVGLLVNELHGESRWFSEEKDHGDQLLRRDRDDMWTCTKGTSNTLSMNGNWGNSGLLNRPKKSASASRRERRPKKELQLRRLRSLQSEP